MTSPIRRAILARLQAGAADRDQLVAAASSLNTSVLRTLREMQADGSVTKSGDAYQLTGAGSIEAALTASMTRGLAAMDSYRAFWNSHDLSGIPEHLLARVGELEQCDCVGTTEHNQFNCQEFFISEMLKSKELRGVAPIIIPGHVDMMDALVATGAKVELIFTPPVIRALGPEKLNPWKEAGASLYEIPAARAAFAVTENMLSLGLHALDGRYDILADLDCYGPGAVRWGRDLYRYYRDLAKPI